MGQVYKKEHAEKLSQWIKDGSIKIQMATTEGIEGAADGFLRMLTGQSIGKAVLKISDL